MTIQEIIRRLENEEEVNFNVAERLIGGSTNLLCRFNNFKDWMENMSTPMTAVLHHSEGFRLGFSDHTVIQKRMNIELPEGNIHLVIKPNNFGCHTEIEGRVDELKFLITTENVKSYFCYLAGGEIGGHMLYETEINEPISWTRKYKYEQDEINAEFKYSIRDRCLGVTLSRAINATSSIDNDIKNEILLVCYILSFCTGSYVTILTRAARSSTGEEVRFEYIFRGVKDDYRKHSLLIPLRTDANLWINFINHILQRPKKDKKWFIDQCIWQAIANLCWDDDGYDDWTFIKHVAALEGLCKTPQVDLFEGKRELKRYSSIRDKAIEAIKIHGAQEGVSENVINQLIENIHSAKRQLIGYPTKWYIETTLIECSLKGYSDNNIEKISDAINKRNEVVHIGGGSEYDVFEYIKLIRNTIYLIVMSRLEYPGKFYLSGVEHEKPTSLQEWQS